MIISIAAAAIASAQPATTAPAPAAQPAGHATMDHGDKKMACCEKMAKGEGCACCKDKTAEAPAPSGEGHSGHDH